MPKKIKGVDDFEVMFTLPSSKISQIKEWEVGRKYKLEVEAEMVSKSKPLFSNRNGLDGRFKITNVKAIEQ